MPNIMLIEHAKNRRAMRWIACIEWIVAIAMAILSFLRCWADNIPAVLIDFIYTMIPFFMCHALWLFQAANKQSAAKQPKYVII